MTTTTPKKVLTVSRVEAAEPREMRYEISDASFPGLFLSVMPSGHKSYVWRYRFGGMTRKLTIGSHPQWTPATARQRAREAVGEVASGIDPAAVKAASRKPSAASGDVPRTIDQLVEKFLVKHARKKCRPSTALAYERMLTKVVLPVWKGRDIAAVANKKTVIALLDDIVDDRPILANRVQSALSSMFSYAADKNIIEINPLLRMKKVAVEKKRQRALEDFELKLLLSVTGKLSRTRRDYVRLLLLSLQRRNEIAHAQWSWINMETCTLTTPSGEDEWVSGCAKNAWEHPVPLSDDAMAILRDRAKDDTGSPYVFNRGRNPFNDFGRLKEEIDRLMTEANGGNAIKHWTLHDLRRSAASVMPRLGVPIAVIEAILNHRGGSFGGIVSTYQVYEYQPEMRSALEKWALHLAILQAGNVVKLHQAS